MEHDRTPTEQRPLDPRDAAIYACLSKLDEALLEWWTADQAVSVATKELGEAESRKQAASEKIRGCEAAASLFGFDLNAEWNKQLEARRSQNQLFPDEGGAQPEPSTLAAMTAADKPKTIREHLIEAARNAYPKSVRASRLRRQLAESGIQTHEKTVGMTLYRLLRERVLRRSGWDWFFVPEDQRQSADAPRDEESPGNDPGLSLEAAE